MELSKQSIVQGMQEGREAFQKGREYFENPYTDAIYFEDFVGWQMGWCEAAVIAKFVAEEQASE